MLCSTLFGCKALYAKYSLTFVGAFDTVTVITGYDASREAFTQNARKIYDELYRYHQLFDIYNEYEGISNLATVNKNAGQGAVKVDKEIIDLLKHGVNAYSTTNGKVNIAMGAVLTLWHNAFDAAQKGESATPPSHAELIAASAHTDISSIEINQADQTVYITDPLASINVGAIAKGYAVERASQLAVSLGCESYLINAGGNVRAISSKQNNKGWQVAVDDPFSNESIMTLSLTDRSAVTSGGYNRYFESNGQKYHHIIDPLTLEPSQYAASVTVICKDSGLADVLSTALFNMKPADGIKFIENMDGAEACYVQNNGELLLSSGFSIFIQK